VVRQSGDDRVVGRHLAERGVRNLVRGKDGGSVAARLRARRRPKQERARAIAEDMLASARRIREPIASRGDILNAFDSITYQKGATVIGMFEGWIGEAPFRRGVRRYLESRRDGNATVGDFLGALETGSNRPVAEAFSTFLDQNGVPQVEVKLQCTAKGATLALSQHRLTPPGATEGADQLWQIPVCARYGNGATTRQSCTLLAKKSGTLALGGCPSSYSPTLAATATTSPTIAMDCSSGLPSIQQAFAVGIRGPAHDVRALLRAGSLSGAQALEWVRAAGSSSDRHVVEAAIELATFVRDTLVGDAERARFAAFVRGVFGDRARTLGYAPRRNESDDDQLLRRTVVPFVANEDPKLAAEARRLAVRGASDRKAIDPGMVDVVLLNAAQTGDATTFDALLAEAKATSDSLDRRNLGSLLAFRIQRWPGGSGRDARSRIRHP
jgi:alanyl aminopeptidase